MSRMSLLTLATVLASASAVLTPTEARADLAVASEGRRSPEPQPERKGFYLGTDFVAGSAILPRGFVPMLGYRFELGGGLSDRAALGFSIGLDGYLGEHGLEQKSKASAHGDVVLTGFVTRGLFIRAGLGAVSAAPFRTENPTRFFRPGIGGQVGLGHEFRVAKRFALQLGVMYDARLRTDGNLSQSVLLSLAPRFYFGQKK